MHGESAAVAGQLAAAALASGRLREFRAGWDPVYLTSLRVLVLSEHHDAAERHLDDAWLLGQRSGIPVIAAFALIFKAEQALHRGDPMAEADAGLALQIGIDHSPLAVPTAASFLAQATA